MSRSGEAYMARAGERKAGRRVSNNGYKYTMHTGVPAAGSRTVFVMQEDIFPHRLPEFYYYNGR